jgi:hypothetical protein
MNIEARIALAKDLIRKREEIDQQLAELFGGQLPKKQKRSALESAEHANRAPPQEPASEQKQQPASPLAPSPFEALSRLTVDSGAATDL